MAVGTKPAAQTAADAGRSAEGWLPSRHWHRLYVGNGVEVCTTDQSGRGGGWVFHVTFDGMNGGDTLTQRGGFATEPEAMRAAEEWLSIFCENVRAALAAAKGSAK